MSDDYDYGEDDYDYGDPDDPPAPAPQEPEEELERLDSEATLTEELKLEIKKKSFSEI
jgi:hypothetical protein